MSTQRSASVSLCMIVRNEAHQLAECLNPLADLFDEVVIVDTGSTDGTRDVARRYTPRVFEFAWCDDFSAARNESLWQARGEWIFWLDADDRLTPDNIDKLKNILASLTSQPRAFFMDIVCRASSSGDMERVVSHPRLFRRHPELRWRGRVHEQLSPWPTKLGLETVMSGVRIDHVGYCDAALAQRKLQRNLRLLRMDYAVDPDDPQTLMELGIGYTRLGRAREARRFFAEFLEKAPEACVQSRRVYASIAELALQEGKFQEVIDTTARGLMHFPDDDYLAYMQTEALYQLGEYEAARLVLMRIIQASAPPRDLRTGAPHDIRRRLAPLGLGEVLRMQGAHSAAEAVLRNVVHVYPNDPVSWHQLGRVYVVTGNWHRLQEVVAQLESCPQGQIFSSMLLANWHLARGHFEAAEKAIDDLVTQAPHMSLPRVLRAQCLQLRGAPRAAQVQACRDVLRVQPGNAYAISTLGSEDNVNQSPAASPAALYSSVVIGAGMPSEAVVA